MVTKMTHKAEEPRCTLKIPVSLRVFIGEKAKQENTTMMEYVDRKIRGEKA